MVPIVRNATLSKNWIKETPATNTVKEVRTKLKNVRSKAMRVLSISNALILVFSGLSLSKAINIIQNTN